MQTISQIIARLNEVQNEINKAESFHVTDAGYAQLLKERYLLAGELYADTLGDRVSFTLDPTPEQIKEAARRNQAREDADRHLLFGARLDEPKAMGQLSSEAANESLQAGEDSVSRGAW